MSMKKKEKESVRGMSDEELAKRIAVLETEIIKGNLGRKIRAKRKEIAIAKTMVSLRHI